MTKRGCKSRANQNKALAIIGARDRKLRGACCVMTNPLENEEEYDGWRDDLSLDNYYEVDYLRGDNYK